jgi:hypothetical protein
MVALRASRSGGGDFGDVVARRAMLPPVGTQFYRLPKKIKYGF